MISSSLPLNYDLNLLCAVIDQAPDAIIATTSTGEILFWNNRAVDIFGYSKREVMDGGLDLIIPEKLRSAHWLGFRAAVAAGKVKSQGRAMLTRATHKSGDKLYVELSFAVMTDEQGKAIGAIGVARDVTQRHLADAARDKH